MPLSGGGDNTTMVAGTYTGDGTSNREIDIGGEAKFGEVIGPNKTPTDCIWFLMKGAETKFAEPNIMFAQAINQTYVRTNNAMQLKSSTNGFTLASGGDVHNNRNGSIYYYVMFK